MKNKVCSSAFRRLRAWPPKGGTTCLFLFAALTAFAFESDFNQAQVAYDNGRYAEAISIYGELASNGIDNVELHYNLANARFKNGNLPEAVWHYRKAWYNAPRDPAIRANLHFALNAAGATEPAPSFIERSFNLLSQTEWIMTAVAGYIAFTLLLILGMLIRPAKRTLTKLSLLPAALILTATGGWWHWQQLLTHPEGVVIKSGATALFGPIEGSTAHYKLPLGALVQEQNNNSKGWTKIKYDNKEGWLTESYIRPVSP